MTRVGTFVVALSASSAVRFEPGQSVALRGMPTRESAVDVKWFTRYADEGYESGVPRELWVDVRGEAESFDRALHEFTEAGRALTVLLALAANAPIDDPTWELAYEDTPGVTTRDFAQRFSLTESGLPRSARVLDRRLVAPMVNAILGGEVDRLHRAAVHYNEALKAWRPGTELRTATHLWMAVEALTKVALRRELAVRDVDRAGLCSAWGIDLKDLDPEVRRRLIFRGDDAAYLEAKVISDAVEHSFESLADLHPRAVSIRETVAQHVRTSILALADMPDEIRTVLLGEPYAKPRESFPLTKVFRGRLVGDATVLGEEGQPYPFLHWTGDIDELKRGGDGSYHIRPRDNLRVALGPGISLRPGSIEVWGPRQDRAAFDPQPGTVVITDPASLRTDEEH
jgi:hypothetical protein